MAGSLWRALGSLWAGGLWRAMAATGRPAGVCLSQLRDGLLSYSDKRNAALLANRLLYVSIYGACLDTTFAIYLLFTRSCTVTTITELQTQACQHLKCAHVPHSLWSWPSWRSRGLLQLHTAHLHQMTMGTTSGQPAPWH